MFSTRTVLKSFSLWHVRSRDTLNPVRGCWLCRWVVGWRKHLAFCERWLSFGASHREEDWTLPDICERKRPHRHTSSLSIYCYRSWCCTLLHFKVFSPNVNSVWQFLFYHFTLSFQLRAVWFSLILMNISCCYWNKRNSSFRLVIISSSFHKTYGIHVTMT